MVAPETVEIRAREAKVGKFRGVFISKRRGVHHGDHTTDRKEPLAGNSVEELKSDTSAYLPGSVKDFLIGGISGMEFRTRGGIGESICREYCAPDNSTTISIQVAKDDCRNLDLIFDEGIIFAVYTEPSRRMSSTSDVVHTTSRA